MSRRHSYKPTVRELTTAELAQLLHLSHHANRLEQRQFLKQLGGDGTVRELNYCLGIAHLDKAATLEARRLDEEFDRAAGADTWRIAPGVCQAVSWFTQAAISGTFGPDDSIYARSAVFLQHPWVIARAVEIFLENLLTDSQGNVLNHEEAERRAAAFIGENC